MARYTLKEWTIATRQSNVTFNYTLIGKNVRKQKGNSGFRRGTRNLELVPASKHPKKRIHRLSTRRYYDQGRKDWRSFRANKFGNMTSFWNREEEEWVDTPSEAGIKGLKDK